MAAAATQWPCCSHFHCFVSNAEPFTSPVPFHSYRRYMANVGHCINRCKLLTSLVLAAAQSPDLKYSPPPPSLYSPLDFKQKHPVAYGQVYIFWCPRRPVSISFLSFWFLPPPSFSLYPIFFFPTSPLHPHVHITRGFRPATLYL